MESRATLLKISVLSAIVFLIALTDTLMHHGISNGINPWLTQALWIDPYQHPIYYDAVEHLTRLGSDGISFLIIVVILGYLAFKRQWLVLCYSIVTLTIIYGIGAVCKELINSPRPLFPLETDSFPSGHTIRASMYCGLLLFLQKIHQIKLPKITIPLVLLFIPLLVGFTRLALGKHWPSDLIASYALSIGFFSLAIYMNARRG